jgi:hypothetical protein
MLTRSAIVAHLWMDGTSSSLVAERIGQPLDCPPETSAHPCGGLREQGSHGAEAQHCRAVCRLFSVLVRQ